jgi:hypothetical protein
MSVSLGARFSVLSEHTCKNFLTESFTHLPHMIASTILEKLSSMRMISEASLATSVPAIPILYNHRNAKMRTSNDLRMNEAKLTKIQR